MAIHDRLPDLYPYCFSAYSQSAFLYYGNDIILSQEGTEPSRVILLDHGFFSNAIHPLLNCPSSNLQLFGWSHFRWPIDSVCRDVAEIREAGAEMGLVLNPVKCELISHREERTQFRISLSSLLAKWILATPPYWGHPYPQVQYLTRPGRTVVTTLRGQWTD